MVNDDIQDTYRKAVSLEWIPGFLARLNILIRTEAVMGEIEEKKEV